MMVLHTQQGHLHKKEHYVATYPRCVILRPRIHSQKANLMFKILNGETPTYLQDLFSVRGTGYNIRQSEMRLNVPRPRTDYMKKSFCYSGAVLFNSLPQNIRKCQSLPQFKKAINKYYSDNLV